MSPQSTSILIGLPGLVLVLGLMGCSGAHGYTQSPEQLTPQVRIIAGDNQVSPVNTAFPTRMKVWFNKNGMSLGGHPITFNAPDTGAGGTFPDGTTAAMVITDEGGVAEAPVFTANGTQGSYTIRAWSSNYSTTFHLTNQPPPPTQGGSAAPGTAQGKGEVQ